MKEIKGYKNKVYYNGEELTCLILSYSADFSVALQLVDSDGIPYFTATVYNKHTKHNVPTYKKEKYAAIKNYSENEGIEQPLIEAGILKKKVGKVSCGYREVPIYEINTNPNDIELIA